MYVDSIYAKTFKEVAKLVSPMTTVPMSGCLGFQYQRGEKPGNRFSVYTRDQLGQYQEVWNAASENQTNWVADPSEWIPVQVDVKAPYPVQVSGEGSVYTQYSLVECCLSTSSSIVVFTQYRLVRRCLISSSMDRV